MKTLFKTIFQLLLIIGIAELGKFLSQYFSLPLPGNMVGMLLLFALLSTGVLPLKWIAQGADLLLSYMAFFFIPAGVALIAYWDLIRLNLVGYLVVIIGSTLLVLISTGKVTDLVITWTQYFKGKEPHADGE